MNCWEFMRCGKEAVGSQAGERPCPAAICQAASGIHYGRNAGRSCWAIDGTLCDGVAMTAAEKTTHCMACAFFHHVHQEETDNLLTPNQIRCLVYGSPA